MAGEPAASTTARLFPGTGGAAAAAFLGALGAGIAFAHLDGRLAGTLLAIDTGGRAVLAWQRLLPALAVAALVLVAWLAHRWGWRAGGARNAGGCGGQPDLGWPRAPDRPGENTITRPPRRDTITGLPRRDAITGVAPGQHDHRATSEATWCREASEGTRGVGQASGPAVGVVWVGRTRFAGRSHVAVTCRVVTESDGRCQEGVPPDGCRCREGVLPDTRPPARVHLTTEGMGRRGRLL